MIGMHFCPHEVLCFCVQVVWNSFQNFSNDFPTTRIYYLKWLRCRLVVQVNLDSTITFVATYLLISHTLFFFFFFLTKVEAITGKNDEAIMNFEKVTCSFSASSFNFLFLDLKFSHCPDFSG